MKSPLPEYPSMSAEHLTGARLFANRYDLLTALPIPQQGSIAEIGVMRGDLSLYLMKQFNPKQFLAVDTFICETFPAIWGIPSTTFFDGLTQLEYFKRLTAAYKDNIIIERGMSQDVMPKYADHSFDMVYIDAGHEYHEVKSDADCAEKMIKEDGILVFNDYTVYDHTADIYYGVVPVVNQMVVNQGWRVVGFCMSHEMFCDIAIQKDPKRYKAS